MLGKNDLLTELYCRVSGGALWTYSVFWCISNTRNIGILYKYISILITMQLNHAKLDFVQTLGYLSFQKSLVCKVKPLSWSFLEHLCVHPPQLVCYFASYFFKIHCLLQKSIFLKTGQSKFSLLWHERST